MTSLLFVLSSGIWVILRIGVTMPALAAMRWWPARRPSPARCGRTFSRHAAMQKVEGRRSKVKTGSSICMEPDRLRRQNRPCSPWTAGACRPRCLHAPVLVRRSPVASPLRARGQRPLSLPHTPEPRFPPGRTGVLTSRRTAIGRKTSCESAPFFASDAGWAFVGSSRKRFLFYATRVPSLRSPELFF